jgi:hypothetical protein
MNKDLDGNTCRLCCPGQRAQFPESPFLLCMLWACPNLGLALFQGKNTDAYLKPSVPDFLPNTFVIYIQSIHTFHTNYCPWKLQVMLLHGPLILSSWAAFHAGLVSSKNVPHKWTRLLIRGQAVKDESPGLSTKYLLSPQSPELLKTIRARENYGIKNSEDSIYKSMMPQYLAFSGKM